MIPVTLMAAAQKGASGVAAHFKAAGAIEPGRAITWAPEDKSQELEFRSLVDKGALVEMRRGTYYLNLEKLAGGGAAQAALVVVAVALAAVGAGMLIVRGG